MAFVTRLLAPLRHLALLWSWDSHGTETRAAAERIAAVRIAEGDQERKWAYYCADPRTIERAYQRYVWRLHRAEMQNKRSCRVVSFERWKVAA